MARANDLRDLRRGRPHPRHRCRRVGRSQDRSGLAGGPGSCTTTSQGSGRATAGVARNANAFVVARLLELLLEDGLRGLCAAAVADGSAGHQRPPRRDGTCPFRLSAASSARDDVRRHNAQARHTAAGSHRHLAGDPHGRRLVRPARRRGLRVLRPARAHQLERIALASTRGTRHPRDEGCQWPGRCRRLRARAFTATRMLEPDIEMAAISGRSVSPRGSKTPAAIGSASEL
jgi:hypothetical protein